MCLWLDIPMDPHVAILGSGVPTSGDDAAALQRSAAGGARP